MWEKVAPGEAVQGEADLKGGGKEGAHGEHPVTRKNMNHLMTARVLEIFMTEQTHQSVSQPPENSDGRVIPQFMRLGALSCCSRSLRGVSQICGEWWFRNRVHELNFGPLCSRCMHPVVGLLFWQNGPCHYGHLDRATPWLQKKRWQGSFDDWTGLVSPAVAGQHTDSC